MTAAPPRHTSTGAIRSCVRRAADRLAAAGVGAPRHDAEELAAYVLGTTRSGLWQLDGLAASALDAFGAGYPAVVERRATREPLQHITGVAYFRHLALAVGPGVFVPRPETELLVDLVAPAAGPGRTVADLCAGSGALGLALATECRGTFVHLVEVDPQAADWLRTNARAISPAGTAVHHASVADASHLLSGVDVVVSNPPYLPTESGDRLEPEVAEYDPSRALWGGPDGLAVLREVVQAAGAMLRVGGVLAVEHDARHQRAVVALFRAAGFAHVRGHLDLTGQPRFVTGSLR